MCSNFTPWINDSGAFDHMASFSHLFNAYSFYSSDEKIRVANGIFSPIARKGLRKISENIDLKSILHALKLAYNLLSMSRLSKYSNTFFDSHCKF